jgi:hypothetical protein
VTEWAASRGCDVSTDVTANVTNRLYANASVVEARAKQYGQTLDDQRKSVKGVTYAYLDVAAGDARGQGSCTITAANIQRTSLPPLARDVQSGTLDVDGTTPGAQISIDGEMKGAIRQVFVVSVGRHVWETMKCKETVAIKAGDYVTRYCDKR